MAASGIKRKLKQVVPRRAWKSLRHLNDALLDRTYRLLCWPWGWLPEGTDGGPLRHVLEKQTLTPERIILGYHLGMFPAPEHSTGVMRWHDPDLRGILPLDQLHVSRKLRQTIRKGRFDIRFNTDFRGVMEGCAESREGRETTWISPELIDLYVGLHQIGFAHSFEAWREDRLVGGGCGVAFGGCFSGTSLFYRESNASKVAFVHLAEKLKTDGFTLFDLWWPTSFFMGFGAIAIPRKEFKERLAHALINPATFSAA